MATNNSVMSRYQEEIETLKRRTAAVREKAHQSAAKIQRDAVAVGAAGAWGALRKNGTAPSQIAGIDADLVVVGGLYIASNFMTGTIADVMHDAALGVACAVSYSKTRA